MNFSTHSNKFYYKEKSDELDRLKEIQKLVESFNEKSDYHYLLRLKYGLRRAWS
jgi:hypothetical protein